MGKERDDFVVQIFFLLLKFVWMITSKVESKKVKNLLKMIFQTYFDFQKRL